MTTVREAIDSVLNPIRRNNLEARRLKLGLSRVALGRILEVDPATVFRHERAPLVALWDYALRGIEAEAASKESKQELRSFKSGLDCESIIPDGIAAQGKAYLAEKMHKARQQHARRKPSVADKPPSRRAPSERHKGQLSKEMINEIADRAEGRNARK